ncbi:MAG: D-glycerate dehydrogenase [Dethiobacter sp.]|nr:D-glycerate dehydrogenase [Dethiobacter sp.]
MKRPRVYVTRKLPQEALSMIDSECEMKINPNDRVLQRPELEDNIKGIEGLLCLITDEIDAGLLDLNPSLRMIANYGVGFNNIDVEACTQRKIPVSNTPGVLTESTADLTWALLMACARRVVEGDRLLRDGKFEGWGPMFLLGTDVYGKTLGIIGLGRIGRAVIRRAVGFNMKVIYHSRSRLSQEEELKLGVEYKDFDSILQEADYVSLHVPLTSSTKHLISVRELKMMKKTAFLINTTRGPVVDEKALVEALKTREIAGAGLDVFEDEPRLADGLSQLDNVVITPHTASATTETRTKMAVMAATNLLAGLKGETIPNLVNPLSLKNQ